MRTINDIRKEINQIDQDLIDTYIKRLNLVEEIYQLKKNQKITIKDSVREAEIMKRIKRNDENEFAKESIDRLFEFILKESKRKQSICALSKPIAIIGFMGTGKSTIGKKISQEMNLNFIDSDKEIEKRENTSVSDIFSSKGETYFRKIEQNIFEELDYGIPCVISTGGGALLNKKTRALLEAKTILIRLIASPEEILQRLILGEPRPLLHNKMNIEFIQDLMRKREAIYKEISVKSVVNTNNKSIAEVSAEIMDIIYQINL